MGASLACQCSRRNVADQGRSSGTGEASPRAVGTDASADASRDRAIEQLIAALSALQLTEAERARVASVADTSAAPLPPETEPEPEAERQRPPADPPLSPTFWYIVWSAPGASEELRGIHSGGLRAWSAIASRLQGGRYCTGRDNLRGWTHSSPRERYTSQTSAFQAYCAEASRHGAPLPVKVFRW